MNYLKNIWYAAAWNNEVAAETLFTRTLLDQSILFFRNSQGKVNALHNRCPHRFAPLSAGKHKGDSVQCGYHGLEFGSDGNCINNPHGDGVIPRGACVKSYPVEERYSLIWIWMGDPEAADTSLIPDFSCMDPEQFYVAKKYLYAKANYILESDNILDLSHIQYLHPDTLGSDDVSQAITSVEQKDNAVWSYRQTINEIMPDFLYKAMGFVKGQPVDRWIDVRWQAPASMLLFAGATPTGESRENGKETLLPHIFTPETAKTTHYFFSFPMPLAMGKEGEMIAEQQLAGLNEPFTNEDLPMLEAQQNMMGDEDFWSLKPISLSGDAPALLARRVLQSLLKEQQNEQ